MSIPHVLLAADPEISRLVKEWQAQAEEAVRVGLRMAERLLQLERDRDSLRLDLRVARDRAVELDAEVNRLRAVLQ